MTSNEQRFRLGLVTMSRREAWPSTILSPAQIALAWLLSFRPNTILIPGTSSMRDPEENMAVGDIELDAAARDALAS